MNLSLDLVICTYNNAVLLDRVLDKIANQRVFSNIKWKVPVVDNNCTDGTKAVVEKYFQSNRILNLSLSELQQELNYR